MNEEEKPAGTVPALDTAPQAGEAGLLALMRQAQMEGRRPEDGDGAERAWLSDAIAPLPKAAVLDPRMRPTMLAEIRYDGANTEEMLHGLMAECHFLMRHVSLPSMCTSSDMSVRREFLNSAMELVRTGTHVAETIGHLRHVEHKAARKAARR
jgi:hypothetical protein